MQCLTLIRHAKSDWSDPDLDDIDRPLNKRGKKAAPVMGKRLADSGIIPDLLLSSPAKRARKTAQLMAQEIGFGKEDIIIDQKIYEAGVETLIALVKNLPPDCHPALFGHNPGLSDLGSWLCRQAPSWLQTCAVLTLELDIEDWSQLSSDCGSILLYTYPKKKG